MDIIAEYLEDVRCRKFIEMVDQTYNENEESRKFLEHILLTSSEERQELYEELQVLLQRSEEKYNRLLENLNNHYFFYTHDTQGIFTYLSESITNILGYSSSEFMKHYEEFLTDSQMNEHVSKYTELAILGKEQAPYQLSIYHKDGTTRYLEVTEVPVFDEDNKVILIDGIARDMTQEYHAKEALSNLARYDTLTSLSNRAYLEEQLTSLISSASREENSFALLFLDLDHFKQINDTLGHDVGDKLLQEVALRIKPNIRIEDIFSRIGGDEFVIVLNNINEVYLITVINKIMELTRKAWMIDTYELNVSMSIGVALYPNDGLNIVDLMKCADIAMYEAKDLGRNNFRFYTDALNTKVHHDMKLEQEMSEALASKQFVLHYQPKQKLLDNEIIGAEALVRWEHPELGLIYPDEFIELAESTGFIVSLGTWIIEESCRAIKRFNTYNTAKNLHVSVNVSTRQLQNQDLYKSIQKALLENDIQAKQFSIEITESIMVDNSQKMINMLNEIKSLGIKICMDDFGTGYSSLSYLNKLPITSLKIDKAFVDDIPKEGNKKIILHTIVGMGSTLGIGVIAEGVEKEYQREYLIKEGYLYYQGYLFSKPLPENEYLKLLRD